MLAYSPPIVKKFSLLDLVFSDDFFVFSDDFEPSLLDSATGVIVGANVGVGVGVGVVVRVGSTDGVTVGNI